MAATIKYGDTKWAVKDGNTLGYNDENSFKPVPFDFTRNSIGTRVDRNGLIETIGNNIPRIDFTDNTDGHLLLEPQSTNSLTYSEDFSNTYWNLNDISVESNAATSPNGATNAFKITITDVTPYLGNLNISLIVGNTYTLSCFVKKGTNRWVRLASVSSASTGAWFDLDNGVVGTVNSTSATIEDYGDGWYRITNTLTSISGSNDVFLGLSGVDGSTSGSSVIGNNVFAWGFQVEALSYPTSYIPTNGSTVTRASETCTNAGNSTLINSTEGVLYAEISSFKNGGIGDRTISISDGSTQNAIQLFLHNTANRINFRLRSGGSLDVNISDFTFEQNQINKIACKYKSGDYALWINGEERATSTNSSLPSGLSVLAFDDGSLYEFYGKVKAVTVYNTALTDAELTELTS